MTRLVDVSNLSFSHGNDGKLDLKDISFHVDEGDVILITGPSGCGKSTLAACMAGLVPEFIQGAWSGDVKIHVPPTGETFSAFSRSLAMVSCHVGLVSQNPEEQLVTFTVRDELEFGPGNLLLDKGEIARRVDRVSSLLGITRLLDRSIDQLSGGEKQLVSIASQLVMGSKVLILDEPTTYLDEKNRLRVVEAIRNLATAKVSLKAEGHETGLAMIVIDHQVTPYLGVFNKLVLMGCDGNLEGVFSPSSHLPGTPLPPWLGKVSLLLETWLDHPSFRNFLENPRSYSVPARFLSQSGHGVPGAPPGSFRGWQEQALVVSPSTTRHAAGNVENPVVSLENVTFSYPHRERPAIKDLSLNVQRGEFLGIIGPNGAGKTTLLYLIASILKPCKGMVLLDGKDSRYISIDDLVEQVGFLFQNPENQLFCRTIQEELVYVLGNLGRSPPPDDWFELASRFIGVPRDGWKRNPFLLSWGQKRRLTLMSILVHRPRLILLDEPFIGHDAALKREVMQYLEKINREGTTIIISSHDAMLLAKHCHRLVILEDGCITGQGSGLDAIPEYLAPKELEIARAAMQFYLYQSPAGNTNKALAGHALSQGVHDPVENVDEGRRMTFHPLVHDVIKGNSGQPGAGEDLQVVGGRMNDLLKNQGHDAVVE